MTNNKKETLEEVVARVAIAKYGESLAFLFSEDYMVWEKEEMVKEYITAICRTAIHEHEGDRVKELEAKLQKRAKQIGVACLKHDLTHNLCCGRCFADKNDRVKELEEALRKAIIARGDIRNEQSFRDSEAIIVPLSEALQGGEKNE